MVPTQIDGRTLVIVEPRGSSLRHGFQIVESGVLRCDGETVVLESDRAPKTRALTSAELGRILEVSASNQVPECAEYQLYILNLQKRGSLIVRFVMTLLVLLMCLASVTMIAWRIYSVFVDGLTVYEWLLVGALTCLLVFGPPPRERRDYR